MLTSTSSFSLGNTTPYLYCNPYYQGQYLLNRPGGQACALVTAAFFCASLWAAESGYRSARSCMAGYVGTYRASSPVLLALMLSYSATHCRGVHEPLLHSQQDSFETPTYAMLRSIALLWRCTNSAQSQ